MAKIQTLTDNFNDNSINTALWDAYSSSASVAETSKKLVITLANATAGANYAGLNSDNTFDLKNSSLAVQLLAVPKQTTNAQMYLQAVLDANNNLQWIIENGTIYAQKKVGGSTTTVGSNTFEKLTYRWLRIREENGTVYFEYSSDGVVWNEFITTATPFNVSAVKAGLGAGTYQSEAAPLTAEFDNLNVLPNPDIEKFHLYKISRNGNYLGLIQNVKSQFSYSQDIGTAGTQITVEVEQSADVSDQPPAVLLDETGDPLLDETGEALLAESADEVIGNSRDDILMQNGNRLEVYEYCKYYPNGKRVFDGKIKKWAGKFGGEGDINLLAYSMGEDLKNYLVKGNTLTSDVSQTDQNASQMIWDEDFNWIKVGQTFVVGAGVTNLGAIDARLRGAGTPYTVTLRLYNSAAQANSGAAPLGTATRVISSSTPAVYRFTFPTPIAVTEGNTYFFSITVEAAGSNMYVYYRNTNVYANGQMYENFYGGGSGGSFSARSPASDLYFVTYTDNGATTVVFEDVDPTTEMIKPSMDNYIAAGGAIGYDDEDIEATGTTVEDYTFITARMNAMIETAMELSPNNFYWTVDIGESKLKVLPASTTPDHTITKGIHVNELELSASSENVINRILFIGGLVAGTNLYREYISSESLDDFGVGLDTRTDNRVVTTSVADRIGDAAVSSDDDEVYQTTLTIPDGVEDLSKYKLGQMLGFNGFGALVDSLLLQIVRIDYNSDSITLSLGVLPPRELDDIKQIEKELEKIQTVDNPVAPS